MPNAAKVFLAVVSPTRAADGVVVPFYLAGGGTKPYNWQGRTDWRGGLKALPLFIAQIEFDQDGWTAGAIPQSANLDWKPNTARELSDLAAYNWADAPFAMMSADDTVASPVFATEMVGTVKAVEIREGTLTMTLSDRAGDLGKPLLLDHFLGTGGIEGEAEAAQRIKRRTWGSAFNVPGELLSKANNIWEFSDPSKPLQQFVAVKDKGRAATDTILVGWAGSIPATLAALAASSPPQGGAALAPSIACVKWWTQPSGPLTADIRGEIGVAYVQDVAQIAGRILSQRSTVTIANAAAILAIRPAEAGIHVSSENETVAQVLDRLLLNVSIGWTLQADGTVRLAPFEYGDSVETLVSQEVARQAVFKPIKTRRVGYGFNYRVHTDSEISAAITGPLGGSNRVKFSQFEAKNQGWTVYDQSGIASPLLVPVLEYGRVSGRVNYNATAAGQVFVIYHGEGQSSFAVTPGERLAAQLRFQSTGPIAGNTVNITFYNETVFVASIPLRVTSGPQDYYTIAAKFVTVPPNATRGYVEIYTTTSGAGAGFTSITEPLVMSANESQIDFPTFVPGPNSFDAGDVTALNQHEMPPVEEIVIQADYQGNLVGGQYPVERQFVRRFGALNVSKDTDYGLTLTGNLVGSIDNGAGSPTRGVVQITGGTTGLISVTGIYLGIPRSAQAKVSVAFAPAPVTGGGGTAPGGGGTPTPGGASTVSTFGAPGTSQSYVFMAVLPAVTVGSAGSVRLTMTGYFSQQQRQLQGQFTNLNVRVTRSTNGGGEEEVFTGTSSQAARRYIDPETGGIQDEQGYIDVTNQDGGRPAGASIVYRIYGIASPTTRGISAIGGTFSATPN